ncbi:MAG: response regulator [Thalassobaculales bacterium]
MSRSPHVLVVDDDREIRALLSRFLKQHGYRVSLAEDARVAMQRLAAGRMDLIVLDLMMPGEDGLALCRRLRAESNVPILMLTALNEESDRILGLEMGADDYLAKPFNPRELLARARAILRRVQLAPEALAERPEAYRFAGWRLHLRRRELVGADGALVPLSSGEYELLLAFVEHPGRVLSREQLLDLARGRTAQLFDRSIDVQVMRLRRKIEPDLALPSLIKTVRNGGYIFVPEVVAEGVPAPVPVPD